ncbi:MAG: Gfo/Idh/MocA family oxidoreductase [Gemmatimonadota bacterium]|jgi:predicted dehydrogenase|nr:Gfo/Idh/MocA family oxidoreductase [Gemmatimonadota bacterium]
MSEVLRLGVVGAGAVLQVAHLPAIKKLKTITVTALCDSDLPKARALAGRYGIPNIYDDIEDLLQHEELDAILICTPNHLHEPHILAALSAGLHVFVEKPIALSAQSAQRIVRAAERSERVVMVGMNHRYRPDAQAVRSFLQSGELGEIDSMRAAWYMARPARAALGWRQRRNESGGGAMLDLGLTMLDLSLWLAGEPVPSRVSASLSGGGRGERGVEQAGSAFVVCDGGPAIYLDVTWRHVGEGEFFGVGVRGSKGSASLNPLRVWKEMHGSIHDVTPTGSAQRDSMYMASFRAQWAHFLSALRGQTPGPDLQEQVTVLRVLDAIYRSAADGREIAL